MITLDVSKKDTVVQVNESTFSNENGILTLLINIIDGDDIYDLTDKYITAGFYPTGVETKPLSVVDGIIQLPIYSTLLSSGNNTIQLYFRSDITKFECTPKMCWYVLDPVTVKNIAHDDISHISYLISESQRSIEHANNVADTYKDELDAIKDLIIGITPDPDPDPVIPQLAFESGLLSIYPGNTGEVSGNDTWVARTSMFDYSKGDTITFNASYGWLYYIFYYNLDGDYMASLQVSQNDWSRILPDVSETISLSPFYNKAKLMVCEFGYNLQHYSIADLSGEIIFNKGTDVDTSNDIDKVVAVFGDSITDRRNTDNNKGQWVDEMIGLVKFKYVKEYATTYATWTNFDNTALNTSYNPVDGGDNTIWNQYNRLKYDISSGDMITPNSIIILSGVNDVYNHNNQIGTVEDAFNSQPILNKSITEINTTCKSIRYLCELIKSEMPSCQIIIVTPYQIANEAICSNVILLRAKMISCCEKLGIDYIDATMKSGICQYIESQLSLYLGDGLHPNVLGGKILGRFLANEISNRIRL